LTVGEVLLDNVDLRKLDLKWLRGQIGLVNQEPALFATTIDENISFGSDTADWKAIEQAAKVANAHSFIAELPEGYQTQVSTLSFAQPLEVELYTQGPLILNSPEV
jgi:ATP-binding cassette subfamily B (MDR/TAP) protein 1